MGRGMVAARSSSFDLVFCCAKHILVDLLIPDICEWSGKLDSRIRCVSVLALFLLCLVSLSIDGNVRTSQSVYRRRSVKKQFTIDCIIEYFVTYVIFDVYFESRINCSSQSFMQVTPYCLLYFKLDDVFRYQRSNKDLI